MSNSDPTGPTAGGGTESTPVTLATGYAARSRRRRIITIAVLVALLAALVFTAIYYEFNRELPIPRVEPSQADQFEAPRYLYSISGTGQEAMTKPVGVAVGKNGRVYQVDLGTRSIRVYRTSGAFLFSFNAISNETTSTTLLTPVHVAVDDAGDVYVTDRMRHGIFVFDEDGNYERTIEPNGDATFPWLPLSVRVDEQGAMYVGDIPGTTVHRIIVLDEDSRITTMFGRAGLVRDAMSEPGVFSYPNGIAVTPGTGDDREIFVADSNNRRIQVFSLKGSFKRFIRTEGTPRGIAIDSKKRLYVGDVLSHQVDVFTLEGERLGSFGTQGIGPGQFRYPEDVALDARGRIYVADRENNQVQVWGYPALQVPGVIKVEPNRAWMCLLPLPLLLLPFLLRRRRFFVTDDFVEAMVAAGMVRDMVNSRWRWIVPEARHAAYEGRVLDGVDLGQLLEGDPHSESDASALAEKLMIGKDLSIELSMAKRCRNMCTEDKELARLALLLGIDVYDRDAFMTRFGRRKRA